ncbi:MAG: DNA repair exonuclease [Bacteroidetes bacterium]|nr:DNA repair exonuclease [Bacteroidota bacterium]
MIRLLCLGDAHLGRYPSRVPLNDSDLSVKTVWNRSIDYAISEQVDAVILTGDMADNTNSYFEAYGALRQGIWKLSESQIPVVAIAGNHDHAVFPALVESMSDDNLRFLGSDGVWTETIVKTQSGKSLRCVGWSFPDAHYDRSPLETLHLSHSDDFTIGIVHGDLDNQAKYAPLKRSDMAAQLVDLWLLGHVHAPKLYDDTRAPVLYPGSLQALDPGEPGIHGPWLITIDQQNQVHAQHLPLASVRYEKLPINISNRCRMEEINIAVTEQLDEFAQELIKSNPELRHLSCRLILSGKTELHRQLSTEGLINTEMFDIDVQQCRVSIDKVSTNTAPLLDLHEIAQLNNDPPGMLARWLLELDQQNDHKLLSISREATTAIYKSIGFKNLGEREPDPETLQRLVTQQAMLLLDELLSQKEENG